MELTKSRQLPKRALALSVVVILLLVVGYWFFGTTVRGGSITLYTIGGWGAPLSVKWDCAQETDIDVEEKFELPLAFDTETKNELKGYWYYSYFRQCLHKAGYDFGGDLIPPSSLTASAIDSQRYENAYRGFSFSIPDGFTLASDNVLDVDWSSTLVTSVLFSPDTSIAVHAYEPDLEYPSLDALFEKLPRLSGTTSDVVARERMLTQHGVEYLYIEQDDGIFGGVFLAPNGNIVHVLAVGDGAGEALLHIAESIEL